MNLELSQPFLKVTALTNTETNIPNKLGLKPVSLEVYSWKKLPIFRP